MVKKEHMGVRVIRYYDRAVKYPYTPGARRGTGYVDPEGNWVEAKRAENREKIKAARYRYARQMISDTVKCMSKNGGIFFTVTSCGLPEIQPKKIARLIDHLKRKYGLLYYTWVREDTKSGLPHWHFAAVFTRRGMSLIRWLKEKEGAKTRIENISDWWAKENSVFSHGNSIRLGWAYKNGRASKYCLDPDAAGYLVKYLMKGQKNSENEQKKRVRRWTTNLDYLRPCRFDLFCVTSYAVIPSNRYFTYEPIQKDADFFANFFEVPFFSDIFLTGAKQKIVGNASYWAQIFYIESPKIDLRALKKYTDTFCN